MNLIKRININREKIKKYNFRNTFNRKNLEQNLKNLKL